MPEKVVHLSNLGAGFALDPVAKKINVTPSADADNALVLGADNLLFIKTPIAHYLSIHEDGGVHQANYNSDGASAGQNSLAVGPRATATTNSAVAVGDLAAATGLTATAVGFSTKAYGAYSLALGAGSSALGAESFAVGHNSVARLADMALGIASLDGTTTTGQAVALGHSSGTNAVTASHAVLVGYAAGSASNGHRNTGVGHSSMASFVGNLGTGVGAMALAQSSGAGNVGVGAGAGATNTGANNTSVGVMAGTQSTLDLATGLPTAVVVGAVVGATSVGYTALATGDNSVAVGLAAKAANANSASVGANSVTSRVNEVSVGAAGATRFVANVTNPVLAQDAATKLYVDSVAGGGVSAVSVVPGAYTVLPTDQVIIHTGAAATYTMPAAGASTGRVLTITNQGTGTVTLSQPYRTASGVTGGTTTTIAASTPTTLRSVRLISDGVQWRRIG